MSGGPAQPVSRRRVVVGTVVAVVAVTALIALTESLRHPLQEAPEGAELDEQDRDPRLELDCPEPQPREDVPRDAGATIGPAERPVRASADELLNCPESFDRRTVRYRGEVIGAVMERRDGAWTQVNDDAYAVATGPLQAHHDFRGENVGIGVLLPPELVEQIALVGGPRTRGDLIEVVGVFLRVDPTTHEVTVIRADSGRIVRPGEVRADPPLGRRQLAAGLLALIAAVMVAAERTVARRRLR